MTYDAGSLHGAWEDLDEVGVLDLNADGNFRFTPAVDSPMKGIPSVQFSAGPAEYTPIGYASVIVGQKRRITPRLTHDQAGPRFQAQFCSRTGEMSAAPLALPGP
jgi:hypothetical protein